MQRLRSPLAVALFAALPALGAEPVKSAFYPGEQSVFDVSYLGVPTGTVTVTVGMKMEQFGKPIWPLVCTAQTDLSIYPVRDRYISYWDTGLNRNIGSEMTRDENHHKDREKFRYDFEKKKIYGTKQKEGSKPEDSIYEAQPGVVDLAGATFSLRNAKLDIGDEHKLPIFTGLVTYVMTAKVEEKKKLKTSLGERDCLRVSFTAEWNGGLQAKRNLSLWVLDDPSHLPVRFEAELVLGSVVADLTTFYPGRDFTR
jgi:hypothetical protein